MAKKWIEIENEGSRFLLSHENFNNNNFFHLTNFIKLWSLQMKNEEVNQIIKESNPLIECDADKYSEICLNAVFNCDNKVIEKSITFNESNSTCSITLKTWYKKSFPVNLNLSLKESEANSLYQEIIQPLLISLQEAYKNRDSLINVILKKDIEIEEYKAGGAILSLKHLETKKFLTEDSTTSHEEFIPKTLLNIFCEVKKETDALVKVEKSDSTNNKTQENSKIPQTSNLNIKSEDNSNKSTTQLFNSKSVKRNCSSENTKLNKRKHKIF